MNANEKKALDVLTGVASIPPVNQDGTNSLRSLEDQLAIEAAGEPRWVGEGEFEMEISVCPKCGQVWDGCTCIRGACDLIRHLASMYGIENIKVYGMFKVLHNVLGITYTDSNTPEIPSLASIDESHYNRSVLKGKYKLVLKPDMEGLASKHLYQTDFDSSVEGGFYKILIEQKLEA